MSFYSLALFAHIVGVLGLFIGIGLQWTSILRLRRALFVAQVREWASCLAADSGRGELHDGDHLGLADPLD